jgi:GNAT superfamily N-acetyltransferase
LRSDECDAWVGDLLESDRRYFEADAESISIEAATIARLRGAESLAAGCVVQRVAVAKLPERADGWVAEVEARLRSLGSPRSRIYLDQTAHGLEAALARRGYLSRVEIGFIRTGAPAQPKPSVELVPADDDHGWSARRKIMERCRLGPDGHEADPDLWVEMERRKSRAGYLRPYLISADGRIVGAACVATCGSLLRLKNLFVDPDCRRRGVATGAAIGAARLAAQESRVATGCFAVAGGPGVSVYTSAGFGEVTRQTEWVRGLEGATV